MNKFKIILLALIFFLFISFFFILEWGWIVSLGLLGLLIMIAFFPLGGTISQAIKKYYYHIFTLRKIEKSQDKEFENYGKKIAVGLSGGVDSSVAAYLLQQQGYEVVAFFMKNWDRKKNLELNNILTEEEICSNEQDYNDAKKVAKFLGIDLIKLDLVDEYWKYVFSKFLKDIENGLTPNPDVLCNKHIKFDAFWKHIKKIDSNINLLATGHYAKIRKTDSNKFLMATADDINKDQTYFLSEIKKDFLSNIKFPLGQFQKIEVREIAKKIGLPNFDKKDSTGICFIGERNFFEFISNYLEEKPGDIIKIETNKIVGKHKGALFYTIGQRKGLNLGGLKKPHYVVNKDINKNIIYVAELDEKNKKMNYSKIIKASNFNDLSENIFNIQGDIIFKVRYSPLTNIGKIIEVKKEKDKSISITIESYDPVKFVTPGQELVLYQNEIVLGGGKIVSKK